MGSSILCFLLLGNSKTAFAEGVLERSEAKEVHESVIKIIQTGFTYSPLFPSLFPSILSHQRPQFQV